MDDLKEATKRRAPSAQTVKAVLRSFFGAREGHDHDRGMAQSNPVYVIVAGILTAMILVVVLLLIVRTVVG